MIRHILSKGIRFIFLLLLLNNIAEAQTVSTDLITSRTVGDSVELKFFKNIYRKYPERYYPLGSGRTFSESHDRTGRLVWKFSFLIMDTTGKAEKKYLREIEVPVVKKYAPELQIYLGEHSHHTELGGHVNFMGFLHGDSSDFIFEPNETGFTASFSAVLHGLNIPGEKEKEMFGMALVQVLTPGRLLHYDNYRSISLTPAWSEDQLTVTNRFNTLDGSEISTELTITFKGNRITGISIK